MSSEDEADENKRDEEKDEETVQGRSPYNLRSKGLRTTPQVPVRAGVRLARELSRLGVQARRNIEEEKIDEEDEDTDERKSDGGDDSLSSDEDSIADMAFVAAVMKATADEDPPKTF